MAEIIACPHGITLPYSSIFNINLRYHSKRPSTSRPSSYFWNRATQAPAPHEDNDATPDNNPAHASTILSESEDEPRARQTRFDKKYRQHLRLRIRKIAFKAFAPKSDGTSQKKSVVRTTEVLSRPRENGRFSIFRSWKLKTKSGGAQLKKMVAIVKHRVSATSPPEEKPKTWAEFHHMYANEQIDVINPPLPPLEPSAEGEAPTPYQAKFFSAPKPANQPVRQLVLNRLGIFGKTGYDPSEEGAAIAKVKIELGNQLMHQGKAPTSLDASWECGNSLNSDHQSDMGAVQNRLVQNPPDLPPESLEQHPVFRTVVQRCRELFQVPIGIISILEDERQVFLAESGLDVMPKLRGLREVTREITFCAHTVLSGRKGFTCLDTLKDWRFQNNPLIKDHGLRFYAGVPLMAPNMDGSKESEENTCPIGTLCLVDIKPREEFSSEDKKKLVYLAEYARREIEKWFAKKIERKMDALAASRETWTQALTRIDTHSSNVESLEPEVLSDAQHSIDSARRSPRIFGTFRSSGSSSNLPIPQMSSTDHSMKSPTKTKPGIFEDIHVAVKPNMRKVFDLATKLVAETLDLSLVYLAASVPYDETTQLGKTVIISGHNLPTPVPQFDTALHLKALKTPEGGLLYQNPSVEESDRDGLQPKTPTSENDKASSNTYASAMLLAVGSGPQHKGGGFILAGYTEDPTRVFGAEDVSYMKQFAHELSRYTSKLRF